MIELLSDPEAWIALATLALLEIVLGIDNIVFIAIMTDRLPRAERPLAYRLGLGGAMFTRIGLLLGLSWVMHLTDPIFGDGTAVPALAEGANVVARVTHFVSDFWHTISGRDLIMLVGGLFLIAKSVHEIYEKVENVDDEEEDEDGGAKRKASLVGIIVQIAIMDIIFSLDSVITAVGMAEQVEVMIAAIVIAVLIMLFFARRVGEFVNEHPSMKVLALSFMMLIGVLLVAEGFGREFPKGYVYAAMGFALTVELLNMRGRKKRQKVRAEVNEAKMAALDVEANTPAEEADE
ncbi:MAG: TerC family protein [Sandaracinaceae bacterium]